jgi:hypothetical protein
MCISSWDYLFLYELGRAIMALDIVNKNIYAMLPVDRNNKLRKF